MHPSAYIVPLDHGSPRAASLGGKGASLCRLVSLGHRVPTGFVITCEGFHAALESLGLSADLAALSRSLEGSADVVQAGTAIQRGLLAGRIPPSILETITQAVHDLGLWEDNRDGIIVRSSASVEDGAAHSFAGIFESLTVAAPERLEATIREVWASAFSPRALTYFREVGLRQAPSMAVVVQRFLSAERSGVMFTRFAAPNGHPRILVEHVEGGCDKLVKGEVTPGRVWLDGPESASDAASGGLRAAHCRELARLAQDLEAVFGAPQDVEWVIYQDAVHLVQSRPITGTFARSDAKPASAGLEGALPLLTGTPASPGAGSGPVRLVFNIEHALALVAGQVLVTPMTNPDMVVAMRRSAAIVTDVGGMICHAAIVSRELGLPCVVGTETATTTLDDGEPVTVDGSQGAVYRGIRDGHSPQVAARSAEWSDLWTLWQKAAAGKAGRAPIVSTIHALEAMPERSETVVLVPDADLRTDAQGLWQDLEGMQPEARRTVVADYIKRLAAVVQGRGLARLYLLPLGRLPEADIAQALECVAEPRLVLHAGSPEAPAIRLDPQGQWPAEGAAVPLGSAAALHTGAQVPRSRVGSLEAAQAAAVDTSRFFGHKPGSMSACMPASAGRARWWALLPEYGRFHRESGTETHVGAFTWLDVRPELVISPLLKSLVQPGFEMVPRVLGFPGVPPLYIKWRKCRYHFRADTFAQVWRAIVRLTWDEAAMADLLRRIRASYDCLREVLALFPGTDAELAAISPEQMTPLITSWWPRWVEFFALCWFIQAQGDDILYPFIEETVGDNLARLGAPPGEWAWPAAADLVLPTTPVLSGEYMADVARLRRALLDAGLTTSADAQAALACGEHPGLAAQLAEHLRRWHWMRDRDLLFEPWDTPARALDAALKTNPHAPPAYAANLRRNLLALGFHLDLAQAAGRATGLNHAARFLHDLNVERENHHVLWLKYSYPLRRLVIELEKRLIVAGSQLEPGDVFFLQAPELIEAARNLPAPLPTDLSARVKNRRRGFLWEARLVPAEGDPPVSEDDYY
jgi:phosphohistidine swiveling domain-containing protein